MELLTGCKEAILSIVLVIIVFSIYLSVTKFRIFRRLIISEKNGPVSSVRMVSFQKFIGLILFGLVPLLVIRLIPERNLTDYGVQANSVLKGFFFALPFALVIIPLSYLNSKKKDNLRIYPLFRLACWDWKSLIVSALIWIVYLIAYEFLFRGFLLFSCLHSFSIPAAILINICLYSMVHIPKGIKETVGSIPAGLVLCLLVIKLGSIWVSVFIHIMMALSNEWFSIAAHPEMEFRFRKSRAV